MNRPLHHGNATLSRRRLLALGGGAAALVLVGCTPETLPGADSPAPAPTLPPTRPVLRFTIGMHIEPFGTTAQGIRAAGKLDYADPGLFARQVQDIRTVASIIERHGGRMTVQAQSPFTQVVISAGDPVLRDLAAAGHEIALHFHEDAHLGPNSSALEPAHWTRVMREEIELIRAASGAERIRYWSGGNLYPRVYEAAAAAGLDVNSDWKSPMTQTTAPEITGVNPWRPSGGTDGRDFTAFATHDPDGPIVFLPEGAYDVENFASARRSAEFGGDEGYFAYLGERLRASLEAGDPQRVNVYHFTIHPGEFRGAGAAPFSVIEDFLTTTVDPLVADGSVQWATFAEMADAFIAWEQAHPGAAAR